MNYKPAFIGFIVIVSLSVSSFVSGCASNPTPAKPTAFVPVMNMFTATESATDIAAGTPAPVSAHPAGVTSTQTLSSTAVPALDPATVFGDFDTLCSVVTAMTDAQQSAFAQQNKDHPIGPWQGRAKEVVPKAAVSFIMNRPNFVQAAGTNLVVNLVNARADYTANKVYIFYGTFISASGSSPKDCQVLMQADSRESANTTVGQ